MLSIKIKSKIKSAFQKLGLEVSFHNPGKSETGLILNLLRNLDITTVIDIGANRGQYSSALINMGYQGHVVSFEPLTEAHKELVKTAQQHRHWTVAERCAIGDIDGEIRINIANNSESSSILPMLKNHTDAAPQSKYIDSEQTKICKLDTVLENLVVTSESIFIKIDTQGFEWKVLDGAEKILKKANAVQIELSLVPLYEHQHLWHDVIKRMESMGFKVWTFFPGFTNYKEARTLQIDAIFVRQ